VVRDSRGHDLLLEGELETRVDREPDVATGNAWFNGPLGLEEWLAVRILVGLDDLGLAGKHVLIELLDAVLARAESDSKLMASIPAAAAAAAIAVDFSGWRSFATTRYGLAVASFAASAPLAAWSSPSWAVRKSTRSARCCGVSLSAATMSRSRTTLAASTIVPLRS
jgi:hypothetical protein